jgi:hypothetical protein
MIPPIITKLKQNLRKKRSLELPTTLSGLTFDVIWNLKVFFVRRVLSKMATKRFYPSHDSTEIIPELGFPPSRRNNTRPNNTTSKILCKARKHGNMEVDCLKQHILELV